MTHRGAPASAVRILAGRWKGRRLAIPASARPTSGRARAALFDILQGKLDGARFLDLYAGSGAVGLEAVSRGAASAVLVEPDAGKLRDSLARLGAEPPEVRVIASSAGAAVEELIARGERFDLVFADPPYSLAGARELARAGLLLAPGATLVLQRDAGPGRPPELSGLRHREERAYGRNVFHFLGLL